MFNVFLLEDNLPLRIKKNLIDDMRYPCSTDEFEINFRNELYFISSIKISK